MESDKLQAWANILGNALGVVGAVVAVLMARRLDQVNRREDLERLRNRLSIQLLLNNRLVYMWRMTSDILPCEENESEETRKTKYTRYLRKSLAAISFSECESFYLQLHELGEGAHQHLQTCKANMAELNTIISILEARKQSSNVPEIGELLIHLNYKQRIDFTVYCIGASMLLLCGALEIDVEEPTKSELQRWPTRDHDKSTQKT